MVNLRTYHRSTCNEGQVFYVTQMKGSRHLCRPTDPTNKKRMGEEEIGIQKMGRESQKIKVIYSRRNRGTQGILWLTLGLNKIFPW